MQEKKTPADANQPSPRRMEPKHLLDNRTYKVAKYLQQHLHGAKAFRLVSAYFSIYGYEMLADKLDPIKEVRFLFGDPASVGELDPGAKEPKSFDLSEKGLEPNHVLQQKHLALRCAEWIKNKRVKIRSISRSNFLHGKMYLAESHLDGAAVVGSFQLHSQRLGRRNTCKCGNQFGNWR